MRILLICTIFCLFSGSCKPTDKKVIETKEVIETEDTTQQTEPFVPIIGKKFFDYDAIDYYENDSINDNNISDLYDNKSKSILDSFKLELFLGDTPTSIKDLSFLKKLEKVGYKKTSIDKSKFKEIDDIFVEKTASMVIGMACINIYRDILIFKKKNKVVGTAKICFGCMADQIHGTKANTENFGQDGDFDVLARLLE